MNYFIFSSPLQCFFASLVSKMRGEQAIGLYYDFGPRSFKDIYWTIVEKTGGTFLSIQHIDTVSADSIIGNSNLFVSNRFSIFDVQFYYKNKNKFKQLNLFEEGSSTYLPHHLHSRGSNDTSLKLRLRNVIFKLMGELPSHLYFNQFDEIYTSLPFHNPCKKNIRVELKLNKENSDSVSQDNSEAMFISQSLVADNILSLDDYNQFVLSVIETLLSKYDIVYYKSHPRDSEEILNSLKEKFGQKMVELPADYKNLPVEIFLFKNRQIDLFGIATSTLFYYSYLMKGNSSEVLSLLFKKQPENVKIKGMMESTEKMLKDYNVIEVE